MRMRVTLLLCSGMLLVGLTTSVAMAAEQEDPLDSGLRIDIALIKFTEDPEDVGNLTIRAHARWRCRDLRPAAQTELKWYFDGTGNNDFDLIGSFVCRDGKLLFKLRSADGSNVYEPLRARKPNRRTVKVTMPLDIVELDSQDLDLVARSKDVSGETCTEDCLDLAPNSGRLKAY